MRFYQLFEDFKTARTAFINQGVDPTEIDELFATFKTLTKKNQFQGNEKNIDWWAKQDWFTFKDRVDQQAATPTKSDIKKARDVGNYIMVREDEQWTIVMPLDKASSVHFGRGSDWCTTKPNQNYFESYFYDRAVTLVYCIKTGGKMKWAIAMHPKVEQMELFNIHDKSLTPAEFKKQTGLDVQEIRQKALTYMPQVEKAREAAVIKDPERALKHARAIKGPFPAGEPIIATSADASYNYAMDVLHTRFKAGEPAILKSPEAALSYAQNIIKSRWPEAEATIAQDGNMSLRYAKTLVKGRFELGEPAIAKNPLDAVRYAVQVIKGRFPEAEPYLLKTPNDAVHYIENVIKGPWPEAEYIISRSGNAAERYRRITGIDVSKK